MAGYKVNKMTDITSKNVEYSPKYDFFIRDGKAYYPEYEHPCMKGLKEEFEQYTSPEQIKQLALKAAYFMFGVKHPDLYKYKYFDVSIHNIIEEIRSSRGLKDYKHVYVAAAEYMQEEYKQFMESLA